MADAICRWRNGTPKTVLELVNSLPHEKMPIDVFRYSMSNKWNGDFFRTAYQLACQLALYCESEDGYYYPRFDHDINEQEAEEYLFFWLPRYYIPNPYTRKDGFQKITCPTYFLKELYEYTLKNPNCTYKEAYEACFQETAKNNDDIIRNYINSYSRILSFSKEGILNITAVNPKLVFDDMDRNNKKDFFDNFSNNNQRVFQVSLLPHQQIFYGAPGTGKSHTINEVTKVYKTFRTTFHPDSDYSTFVGAYKPAMVREARYGLNGSTTVQLAINGKPIEETKIEYRFVKQAFMKAYIAAWKAYTLAVNNTPLTLAPTQTEPVSIPPVFLIIEEINRGNCAQIFGDLFQLLDREEGFSQYPIHADEDIRRCLLSEDIAEDPSFGVDGLQFSSEQKSVINSVLDCEDDVAEKIAKGEVLVLPPNLYIWATMNTSDQSLFPIDSAFKRRWEWRYMPIAQGRDGKTGNPLQWRIVAEKNEYDWWSFLQKISEQIASTTSSEDKKLGFFFTKAKDGVISAEKFVSKVIFYLWNDVFKDYGFDNKIFQILDEENATLTFDKFYTIDNMGNTIVRKDLVERFLEGLGVEKVDGESFVDEESEDGTSNNNFAKYSFNGSKAMGKSELGYRIMDKYLSEHPEATFEQIKQTFPDNLTAGVPNKGLIVELTIDLASYGRYYANRQYRSADGIEYRIFKQWTIRNIDNIIAFAKNQGWSIEEAGNWDRTSR